MGNLARALAAPVTLAAFFTFAACYVEPAAQTQPTTPQTQQGGYYAQTQGGYAQPQQQGYAQQGGSCEGACSHYLQCKGVQDQNTYTTCVLQCRQQGWSGSDLASYTASDCASAIAFVQGQGGGAGGGGGGSGNSQCNGCVRDGNDCVWISQSNWGTGNNSPYSGAVSNCDPSCCGM